MSSDEKPAFAPVGEMLEPLEPVVPDQPRRRSALAPIADVCSCGQKRVTCLEYQRDEALAGLARLREAVTALAAEYQARADDDPWDETSVENVAARLRSLLDKP